MNGERVRFQAHIAVKLAFADLDGEYQDLGWGQIQVLYPTTDGRILYAERDLATRINSMNLRPGEFIVITRRPNPKKRCSSLWDLERFDTHKEAPRSPEAPTELEQQLAASLDATRAPSAETVHQAAPAPTETRQRPQIVKKRQYTPPPEQPLLPFDEMLTNKAKALTDAYAATLAYSSEKHGASVTPDAVRSLVITAYISVTNRGRGRFDAA